MMKKSPGQIAGESARDYRVTGDIIHLKKIRKTLSFLSPRQIDDYIRTHTTDYGKRRK